MTNLIKADFNGTQVLFQNNAYLNATSIAKRFNKQPKDYLRNERTKDYVNALLSRLNSKRQNRLLTEKDMIIKQHGGKAGAKGTWLHPKLAIDFARWLSAEFAVWCDEQIETILYNVGAAQPKLDDLSNSEDRVPLRQAVSVLVTKRGVSYSDAYTMVNQRMGTSHFENLSINQVSEAIEYVHKLVLSNTIEGELLPQKKSSDRRVALLLMKKGSMAKAAQLREMERLEDMVFAVRDQLNTIKKYSGSISDGLSEAQVRIGFTTEESEGATEEARDSFFARYGKQPI